MADKRSLLIFVSDGSVRPVPSDCIPAEQNLGEIIRPLLTYLESSSGLTSNNLEDYDVFDWDLQPMDFTLMVGAIPFPGIVLVMTRRTDGQTLELARWIRGQELIGDEQIKGLIGRQTNRDSNWSEERARRVDKIRILFLAADPTDASRLRLGEELREIQEKLQLAQLRERFELHQRMSVRPADISQALLDVQPKIVHFSGHGTTTGALCLENQVGETHPVQPHALAALFEQFAHQVNCVLLSACYAEIQAKAIAEHIEYVVGMNQAMGDRAAIAFTIGFYQALGAGCAIEQAYKLGCVQIRLQDIPEQLTPVLIKKGQTQS
jgi:hypothetical protein